MRIQSEPKGHVERMVTCGHSGEACLSRRPETDAQREGQLTTKDRRLLEQLTRKHAQMPV